jgi:hypothetical protein
MTRPLSTDELIARAKHYIRTGGIMEVTFSDGLELELPVAIMSLVPDFLWLLFAGSTHPHGGPIDWIREGEDDRVMISTDGGSHVYAVWPTWNKEQDDALDHWLEGTKTVPVYIGVSPDPPDQVRYEGH